ncbi:MAG: BrxA family protein [Phycisphaerae bacterium]
MRENNPPPNFHRTKQAVERTHAKTPPTANAGPDATGHHAMVEENVLQARNTVSALRIGRLVRQRLELMKPDLWRLVRDGSGPVATHAALAAAIKHSPLLGDFLDLVVREQFRVFNTTLSRRLFDDYLYDCWGRDPEMPEFNETTRRKLQTTIYHILVQSGYLTDTRTLQLQRVFIAEPVVAYLERNHERYVLRCMQVGL